MLQTLYNHCTYMHALLCISIHIAIYSIYIHTCIQTYTRMLFTVLPILNTHHSTFYVY